MSKKVKSCQCHTQSCFICLDDCIKGNLCQVDVSYAWHDSCVTTKSSLTAWTTKSDWIGWELVTTGTEHKLGSPCTWTWPPSTNFNFDLCKDRWRGPTTAHWAWGKNNDVREIGTREGEEERPRESVSAMTAKQGLAGSLKETINVCSQILFHCVAITFRPK